MRPQDCLVASKGLLVGRNYKNSSRPHQRLYFLVFGNLLDSLIFLKGHASLNKVYLQYIRLILSVATRNTILAIFDQLN